MKKQYKNILKSNYKDKLLQHLKFLKLNVYNVPNGCLEFFEENDILYEEYKDYDIIYDNSDETILERGYLKRDDFDEIKSEGITHLDLAKLQNGNHDCLTYPDLFKIYNDEIIKEDLLLIIHNSITTNVYFSDRFFANMYYCLGNIPYLIDYLMSKLIGINYSISLKNLLKNPVFLSDFKIQAESIESVLM